MTVVVDAGPLIELFSLGPREAEVADLLKRESCVVSSVNLDELAYTLGREEEVAIDDLRRLVEPRLAGLLTVTAATAEHAWRAAELRERHYHRRRRRISLADCFLLATADPGSDTIFTADRAAAEVARDEGIDALVLGERRP